MEASTFVKRLLDICLSLVGLLAFAPIMLGLAAAVRLTSTGPILYRGRRIGLGGKPFHIFKYRSMVQNAEQVGGSSTSDRDPRITAVGHWMRKYKLDELPQLLNVLRGEMSLVGPRPQVASYVERFTPAERVVLSVRPGMSDWASIWNSDEGAVLAPYDDPDAAYDRLIHPTKMQLQIKYARERTLWIDLKIIASTLLCLVRKGWVPPEIRQYRKPWEAEQGGKGQEFITVTEIPGAAANAEQWSMLHTRYAWVGEHAAGKEVLEVACGSGIGLAYLASQATRVVGGDCDPELVQIAKQNLTRGTEVEVLDAAALPMKDASFDVVALLEAIYYLPSVETFFREARRVLRPGGKLLLCSANCERPDFNPSPFHVAYLTAAQLCQELERVGFAVTCFGAFPVAPSGELHRIRETIRATAVRLHLIPKTMKWKARLKRIFFGPLKPLPQRLEGPLDRAARLIEIQPSQPITDYKVLYIVAQRDAVAVPQVQASRTAA